MRLTALAAIALALVQTDVAGAQPARRTPVVGMLCTTCWNQLYPMSKEYPPTPEGVAFQEGLRESGYVPGESVQLDDRYIGTRYDQLERRVVDLVRTKPDVVLVMEAAGAQAARKATTAIPIVMLGVPDAVRLGLVASLARPGGNVTGVTVPHEEMVTKQLELIREVLPRVSRVAVLSNPNNPEHGLALAAVERAARGVSVEVQRLVARGFADLEGVLSEMRRERTVALIVLPDYLFYAQGSGLRLRALQERVAMISTDRSFAAGGGLMSFGPAVPEMYRRAAYFVARILKGARPADLPVEQPTRFHLAINVGTARALGLTIPEAVRIRVDEVID